MSLLFNRPKILVIGASGYVGSRISRDFASFGWLVTGCDVRPPVSTEDFAQFYQLRYSELTDGVIESNDLVLFFSGHSSVKQCINHEWESIQNNVIDLAIFFNKLRLMNKMVIYASSASVLSSKYDNFSLIADEGSSNAYDAGKLAFDIIAPYIGVRCLGLRLGTVCGWSPNMRWDTVFNAMNRSARTEGVIRVSNSSSFRSLLFMDDLISYLRHKVERHIAGEPLSSNFTEPLGSWSGTIGQIAVDIGAYWKVPIEFGGDTATYSFVLNDRFLKSWTTDANGFYMTLLERCSIFSNQLDWK